METLLRSDACKITDYEFAGRRRAGHGIAGEIDSQRNHIDLLRRNTEIPLHEGPVVFADSDKRIYILDVVANQCERLAAIGFGETFQEEILALQSATYRAVQRFSN